MDLLVIDGLAQKRIRSLNSSWSARAANKPYDVQVDSPRHSKLYEKLECVVCSHHARKVCPCGTVVVVEEVKQCHERFLGGPP